MPSPDAVDSFITRWENSGAAERANYQMFLAELCDVLEVPRPDPTSPDPAKNLYVFDRAITRVNPDGTSVTNYIDLYKARHFVNETKQGVSDCSVGLRPSLANEEAPPLVPNGIDAHRATLQDISSASSNFSVSASQHFSICPDTRLVALNHARAAEEKRGLIRWLRPDYQNPNAAASQPIQTTLQGTDPGSSNQKSKINNPQSSITPSSPWPDKLPAQVTLIRQFLTTDPAATAEQLSARFGRKNAKRTEQIEGIIETLRGLGQV